MSAKKEINKYLKFLNYKFQDKPLIVGGYALQYYGIRKAGHDIDMMVSLRDWKKLTKLHPNNINHHGGNDSTINIRGEYDIDLIKTLYHYDYKFLSQNSKELNNCKIISIENQFLVKALPALQKKNSKSVKDSKKIIDYIIKKNYNI